MTGKVEPPEVPCHFIKEMVGRICITRCEKRVKFQTDRTTVWESMVTCLECTLPKIPVFVLEEDEDELEEEF